MSDLHVILSTMKTVLPLLLLLTACDPCWLEKCHDVRQKGTTPPPDAEVALQVLRERAPCDARPFAGTVTWYDNHHGAIEPVCGGPAWGCSFTWECAFDVRVVWMGDVPVERTALAFEVGHWYWYWCYDDATSEYLNPETGRIEAVPALATWTADTNAEIARRLGR